MNYLKANYDKILGIIKSLCEDILDEQGNYYYRKKAPKMADIEIVALSLTAEKEGIDSENHLFRKINTSHIPNLIERSQYNKRRKKLFDFSELVREKLYTKLVEYEDTFIIDSMPLEICRLSRERRSKICQQEFETSPSKGFCASQNMYFFGYKLHGVCTLNGIFTTFDLTKASVHDISYLEEIKNQLSDCLILGDRGYLSSKIQLDLFETVNINLETPMRCNQNGYKKQAYIFRKSRKRIETLFSQLCDQFMIRRNYAKSFQGFKTRILAKITSMTVIQYINKFVFDRNINNLKFEII